MGEALSSSPLEDKKTIKEFFESACPYLMAIGMTCDEFWNKDPHIVKYYLKANEIRRKQENERLWLQGYYNYIAFAYVSPIMNSFAKRGTKPIPYPKEPIPLTQEDIDEKNEIARQNRLRKFKEQLIISARKNGG